MTRKTKENHPPVVITTTMLSGYTESQLYRQLGIIYEVVSEISR
jgi:hypothetical protein